MSIVFLTWLLVFIRASAFLLIFPLFSMPNVPIRLRVALAGFIALFVAPGLPAIDVSSMSLLSLVLLLVREVTFGLLLSYVTRMMFYGIQLAGTLISTELGLQTSTLITPVDSVPVDVPAAVLNLLAMMLLLSLDIHHYLIAAFQQSFIVMPIGRGGLTEALFDDLTLRIGKVFLLGVQIASPLMAVGFLISFVMMMLGRAVPQMNIFFESFTVRLLGGLSLFGMTLTLGAQRISDYLKRLPEDIVAVSKLVGLG
jgi:flagellar biosynthetic protein FliR